MLINVLPGGRGGRSSGPWIQFFVRPDESRIESLTEEIGSAALAIRSRSRTATCDYHDAGVILDALRNLKDALDPPHSV